jgi:hypothetical protein
MAGRAVWWSVDPFWCVALGGAGVDWSRAGAMRSRPTARDGQVWSGFSVAGRSQPSAPSTAWTEAISAWRRGPWAVGRCRTTSGRRSRWFAVTSRVSNTAQQHLASRCRHLRSLLRTGPLNGRLDSPQTVQASPSARPYGSARPHRRLVPETLFDSASFGSQHTMTR